MEFYSLTYLKGCVCSIVWHLNPKVCTVFLELVGFCQLSQIASPNQGLEMMSLTSKFDSDVELLLVTGSSKGRQHWKTENQLSALMV